MLAGADLVAMLGGPTLSRPVVQAGLLLALALVCIGLVSSVFHLGRPRNAWKSLSRLRSSWLSREAAAALLLIPCCMALLAANASDARAVTVGALALATILLSWSTLYFTAMIYASLVPIRAWHTRRVPLAFFVLGHASGAVLIAALLRAHGDARAGFEVAAAMLLLVGAVVKLDYYAYIASDVRRLTLEQAIGVPQGVGPPGAGASRMQARLFDVGHSGGTFLTREFGYTLRAQQRTALRLLVWVAAFIVPLVWLAVGLDDAGAAVFAVVACLLGLGAERWLFFAEARHTVRLYHGDRST